MKILIVIPGIGAHYGGPSKSVLDLVQARLDFSGTQADIVTTNANGSVDLDVPLRQWIDKDAYRIQYFPYSRSGDYKVSASLTRWLFQHAPEYDLVHTNAIFSYPVAAAWWACRYHKIPYIITPHGMLEPWALAHKGWKKKLHYESIERGAFASAHAVQVLNASEASHVKSLGINSSVVCVPNGIYPDDFDPLPDTELFYREFPSLRGKKLILFLARIDPKKGLDLLAPAFARVHKRFPETHLVVAGPDLSGFLPTAQGYFAGAGCAESVTFTGMIQGSIKHAALAAASLYVAPSYSEGFSVSVLEGMAAGLPCVITTGCNFPEAAIARVARVVDISVDAIADALIERLEEPREAEAMGKRARRFIFDNYTWDRIAARMAEVYTAIVNKQPLSEFEHL